MRDPGCTAGAQLTALQPICETKHKFIKEDCQITEVETHK